MRIKARQEINKNNPKKKTKNHPNMYHSARIYISHKKQISSNSRILLINSLRKFAIRGTLGALSLAAGENGRQLGPAWRRVVRRVARSGDSSAHRVHAEETAGTHVETRCVLNGEKWGTLSTRDLRGRSLWRARGTNLRWEGNVRDKRAGRWDSWGPRLA